MDVQKGSYSCFCHAVKEKSVKFSANQTNPVNEDFDFSKYTENSNFNFEISQTEITEFFYSNDNNDFTMGNLLEEFSGENLRLKLMDVQNALDYLRLVFMKLNTLSKIKDVMLGILT